MSSIWLQSSSHPNSLIPTCVFDFFSSGVPNCTVIFAPRLTFAPGAGDCTVARLPCQPAPAREPKPQSDIGDITHGASR